MSFNFGASANPQNPQVVVNPPPQQRQNPFATLLAQMGQRQSNYNPMDEAQADIARLGALRHDPQGDANRSYVPGQGGPGSPWSGPLQFNNQASQMSPEARMATQGGSAANQWAQLGGDPGVSAFDLTAMMRHMTPIPGSNSSAIPSVDQFSDPSFIRRQQGNPFSSMFQGTPQQGQMPGGAAPDMATMRSRLSPHAVDESHTDFSGGQMRPMGPNPQYLRPPTGMPPNAVIRGPEGDWTRSGAQGDTGASGPLGMTGANPFHGMFNSMFPRRPTPFGVSGSPQPGFNFSAMA